MVLFCKTFLRDIDCFLIQAKSIKEFNVENLPYYISVPTEDIAEFEKLKQKYGLTYQILADETISKLIKEDEYKEATHTVNYINQQLVKFEFSKTNIAKHYLLMDADCYFIRDFRTSDFLLDSDTPYLPLTEGFKGDRILFQLFCCPKPPHKARKATGGEGSSIEFIGRKGKHYTIEMPFVITSSYKMKNK